MQEVEGYWARRSEFEVTHDKKPSVSGEAIDMRYVDEFRDPELISRTAEEIRRLAGTDRHYRFMEVCGGHTHAIYRFGLKDVFRKTSN